MDYRAIVTSPRLGSTLTGAGLIEALDSGVVHLDEDRRILYLNPAAEHLLKVSLSQARGRAYAELCVPEGPEGLDTMLDAAVASGRIQYRRALPLHRVDGDLVVLDMVISALEGSGWLIELRSVELSLRQTEEALQERVYLSAQEMLRGLAHEIKNPLGGLRGAAQLLDAELPRADLREYTRIILHEVDRLRGLVDRLRGPAGAPVLQSVNIHAVLEHCRRLLQTDLPEGMVLRFDYDPSLPEIQADPGQLVQVFLNLLRNAEQAVQGRGQVLLRTRIERQVPWMQRIHSLAVRVDVVDDGPGIPADFLPRIFLPLITTRPEGMGMGLAIVQGIVRAHGGAVHCRSRPGETVFSVWFPLERRS